VVYILLLIPLAYLLLQQPAPTFYTVVSGSMEPYIPRGSLVVVEASPPGLGDVGAYRLEAGGRVYVLVHRVVGVGDGFYVFKGDAVDGVERVSAGDVLGRAVLTIPYIGYIYLAGLANPLIIALLAISALLPGRSPSTFYPFSLTTGLLAFLSPGRGLTALMDPLLYLAYSSSISTFLYILERWEGPHWLITTSHILLTVANVFSTEPRGVMSWIGLG
jgi:signal peptidase